MKAAAVIVAGGSGQRLGRPGGKQLAPLAGRPVLAWSVAAVAGASGVAEVVVACHPERVDEYRAAVEASLSPGPPLTFVAGGESRRDSVAAGLSALSPDVEFVVVHDGARPLVTPGVVGAALAELVQRGCAGVVIGHPSIDTVKVVSGDLIEETPDRARLWVVQTPQVFRIDALWSAHRQAVSDGFVGTDDASLVERIGGEVAVLEGPRDNIKVTVPEDVAIAEAIMAFREGQEC